VPVALVGECSIRRCRLSGIWIGTAVRTQSSGFAKRGLRSPSLRLWAV